jgi:hypothetical protein
MMVASPPVVTVRSKSFEHMRRRIHAFHMRRRMPVVTVRESVLFIGTQFSILYTSMHSPA